MRTYRKFNEYLEKELQDPEEAKAYLELALEEYRQDKDRRVFLRALGLVAKAQEGGIAMLAERASLNRQSLYKALSEEGNPRLETLEAILSGLGYRLSIEPVESRPF